MKSSAPSFNSMVSSGSVKQTTLTPAYIFRFWLPLAATWFMMSVEGPFLAAVIARLADPKFNLAAYGVAFSFALIVEAPIIMIMSASTALVRDKQTYYKLRNFTFFLNAVITLGMLIGLIPAVFTFVAEGLIDLPHDVARLTYGASILLLPWPGAIGFRRFYQGLLISGNRTRRVAYGTMIRLGTMAATGITLYHSGSIPGAWVGAAALSAGVTLEAIATRIMAHQTIGKLCRHTEPGGGLSYRYISHFYWPLALTSILSLGVQPLVTFFMGHSRYPVESLAVLPVVNSLVFIFRSMGLSFQEVGIALMGKNGEGYPAIRHFALLLASSVVVGLGIVALTPISGIWFQTVSGLSSQLTGFAILPAMILVPMPGLSVIISFQRALLVHGKQTVHISWATAIEVLGIIITLWLGTRYFHLVGATAAALGFLIGRIGANLWLTKPCLKARSTFPF